MRLRRLDLIRYGKFSGTSLDFGDGANDCDVTVVYGANEAGKSTAFAAWLDLLFGMKERQHPFAFRFERKDMMIGAEVEVDSRVMTLHRSASRKGSLTDENGHVIDAHRLTTMLYGLDRDAYRTRFSLDEAVLRQGGDEIARAQGDLGRLLHAGTSGLSGIADTLDTIAADVAGFHKKSARATTLAKAKKDLAGIELKLKDARLDPRQFDVLRSDLTSAKEDLQRLKGAYADAKRQVLLREAADKRRALAADIDRKNADLAAFPEGPDLPADAVVKVTQAVTQKKAALRKLEKAEQAEKDARGVRDGLTPDQDGLDIDQTLQALDAQVFEKGEPLLPRVQTDAADLPNRNKELETLKQDAQTLAFQIAGRDATAADITLPREILVDLRDHVQAVRTAETRLNELLTDHRDAEAGLGSAIEMPQGLDALSDALADFDHLKEDPESLGLVAAEKRLEADRAAIGLGSDWQAIVAAGLPESGDLKDIAHRADHSDQAAKLARDQLIEEEETLAEKQAERDAVSGRDDVISDDQIEGTRQQRDAAWARHVSTLDQDTADAFEAEMRADDQLRQRHATYAENRLLLIQLEADLDTTGQRVARRQRADAEAVTHCDTVDRDVATAAIALGLPEDTPATRLADRRDDLAHAAQQALTAEAAEALAKKASAKRDTAFIRVKDAFLGAGSDLPAHVDLVAQARRLKKALRDQVAQSKARTLAAQGLATLTAKLEMQHRTLSDRQSDLDAMTNPLWCAGLTADQIVVHLPAHEELTDLRKQQTDLEHRIAGMDAALAIFEVAAARLRTVLNLGADTNVTDLLTAARKRAESARALAQKISGLDEKITLAQADQSGANDEIVHCSGAIAAVFLGQSIDASVPAGQMVGDLAKRDKTREEIQRMREIYHRAGTGFDVEELATEGANDDPVRTSFLEDELAEIERNRDTALTRVGEMKEALRQALNQNGGVELDQARATLLETLREDARIAATQLMGLLAARSAFRRFRQDRRGTMLDATERAFARLTHGEWPRLETQSMGRDERLVGIRDDIPVAADAMSTGTRGQLYLALRMAGHADFVARNGPLPFITDDIHETFDNRRAEAALELASDMGRIGQAILFTHHHHLVDLAMKVIPGVNVLHLAEPQ